MHHAIILQQSLSGPESFLEEHIPFALKHMPESGWVVQGIEVGDSAVDGFIAKLQQNMQSGPWYNHLYNESGELIVVFKERVYRVADPDEIMPVWEYAKELEIPEDQMQFEPASFEEEEEYFNSGSLNDFSELAED